MPAKRTVSHTPPASKQKKPKLGANQSRLDTFFGGVSIRDSSTSPLKSTVQSLRLRDRTADIISDDESYAKALAERDGIDVDMMRKLEVSWSNAQRPIIDVDLIEDEFVQGSSSGTPRQEDNNPAGSFSLQIQQLPCTSPLSTPVYTRASLNSPDPPVYPPLSVDPLLFSFEVCPWLPNKAAPYSFLAHVLSSLTETRSRIAILGILTNTLRCLTQYHPASVLPALYLLSNSLSPPYFPLELGLGPSIISKAIQHVSGRSAAALKRLYKSTGDVGDVAFETKSNVRTLIPHPPLLITGVYDSLLEIARTKGTGAAKQKQSIVEKLLVAAKGEESRFLVRTLSQNLRVGAVRTSILTALARAMVLTPPAALQNDSGYRVSKELLSQVTPLVGNGKKKPAVDEARDAIIDIFTTAEGLIKRVYVQHPNFDRIAAALLEVGIDGLAERVPLTVGIPLHPTLGSPTRSLDEVYEILGDLPFTAEFKYDGQRAQVHAVKEASGEIAVKIFSRHLEDMTDKYPDVVSLVQSRLLSSPSSQSFIIDAEIVAVNPADGTLRSFQELSNRARKDVLLHDVKVAVCVFAFDLLYLDGQILLNKSFRERRERLHGRFPPIANVENGAARFAHVESCESADGREVVEEFWQRAVEGRSEGLMIKLLDNGEVLEEAGNKKGKNRRKPLPATYEPDKRTSAWLKLKKDYVTGLGDSIDVVPIGAWYGNGRKAQWWSPILLALWDGSQLVAVCKCMSGFTDAFYKDLSNRYAEDSNTCSRSPIWGCNIGGYRPAVYFKPQEVWEIRGADITLSPVSVAALGLVSESRGLSLRFPRFIRLRDDKGVEQASTPEFFAKLYKDQEGRGRNHEGVDDGDLVDAYEEEIVEEDEYEIYE